MNEEEVKTKYIELQMLAQQIKQAEQQLQQLDLQIAELTRVMEDLSSLKKIEKGTEIFTPVTAGIFAKAKIEKTDELLVNIGANVAVKKSIDDTKQLISRQIEEISGIRKEMDEQFRMLDQQAVMIQEQIIKSKVKE